MDEGKEPTLVDRIERAGLIAVAWAGAAGFSLWFVVQLGYWFLGWFA